MNPKAKRRTSGSTRFFGTVDPNSTDWAGEVISLRFDDDNLPETFEDELPIGRGLAADIRVEPRSRRPSWPLRELQVLMERPFFSLDKRPRRTPLDSTGRDGVQVTVAPASERGVATIYDAEILTALTTLEAQRINTGTAPRLDMPTLLRALGRSSGGSQHRQVKASLERLAATRVRTNLGMDGKPGPFTSFSLVEDWRDDVDGLAIVLPEWLRVRMTPGNLLALNPTYFQLGGLERFLYRVARKHAGSATWTFKVETLYARACVRIPPARFRFEMRRIVRQGAIPDYDFEWIEREGGPQIVMAAKLRKNDLHAW